MQEIFTFFTYILKILLMQSYEGFELSQMNFQTMVPEGIWLKNIN